MVSEPAVAATSETAPSKSSGSTDSKLAVWICLGLALLTLLSFATVVGHDFVEYDDQDYITENAWVQQGLSVANIRWAFTTTHASNWHPITWLSHMLDCQLFGMNAGMHHVTNLVIHTVSGILLFLLLRFMTGFVWRSAFIAALFAIHPMHVQSVAWVSERKDVLSGLFFMLTLWAYAWYARSTGKTREQKSECVDAQHGGQRAFFYLLALVFFALGLLSKPMLVTVPFVLLLIDSWPLNRYRTMEEPSTQPTGPGGRRTIFQHRFALLLLEKIPFFVLAALSSVVTFYAQKSQAVMGLDRLSFTLGDRLQNVPVSYARYVAKLFWPVDLAAFYPTPPQGWPIPVVVFSGLLLLIITLVAVSRLRSSPWFAVGWFLFVGMLVPVIGLVQVGTQSIADRYTYLPYVGLFIVLTWAMAERAQRSPQLLLLLRVGAVALVLVCAALTAYQARFWEDTLTLFQRARAVTPNNWLAEYSVGAALVKKGRVADALPYFQEAVRIKPDYGEALNNLGMILVMKGEVDAGIERFRQAIASGLVMAELHYNLGAALASRNKFDEAVKEFEQAIKLKPGFHDAHCQLALALARSGRFDEAYKRLAALENAPGYARGHLTRGYILALQSRFAEAVTALKRAVELDPSDPEAHFELANALLDNGQADLAEGHYKQAQESLKNVPARLLQQARQLVSEGKLAAAIPRLAMVLRISEPDAATHQDLGLLLAQTGRMQDSVVHFREALKLLPDANGHYRLAMALNMSGERAEALTHYRAAMELQPNWPLPCNDLAWILATSRDGSVRNGPEAVTLAERAVSLSNRKVPVFIGTLAAAYAEAGQFDQAIVTAEEARKLALEAGQEEIAKRNEELLGSYRQKQPVRE